MAVCTWDSRARHYRCDLWRVVKRDDGPRQCTDVGRRTLTMVSVVAPAGPPISGAINHSTGGYTGVEFFAAA